MSTVLILSFIISQNSWLWEFKKNPNNPVVPRGVSGEWDWHYVLDGHLLKDEDTLKLYYVGYKGYYEDSFPSKGIGYSYSYDTGKTWTKYPNNPVFVSDSSGWERTFNGEDGLWEAAMRKDNGIYKMWYQAKDSSNYQNSLYATSNDGIHWIRRNNHLPVLKASHIDRHWDSWWAGARNVIYVRDSFYLFYEGIQRGTGPVQLGLAVGPNETTFVKVDTLPVFTPKGTEDTLWSGDGMIPSILYLNSTFVLFYSGGNEYEQPAKVGVGLAFSKDGCQWRRYKRNPIYNGGVGVPATWDSASFTFINVENVGSESEPLLLGTYRSKKGDWPEWHFEIGLVTIDAKDLVSPESPLIISPQNGAIISTPKPNFCYTRAEDNFSGIEYYIITYGARSIETEDTVYIPANGLEDGQYRWKVQAIDSAGWESEWTERTFIIDTKPPAITNTTRWDSTEFAGPFPVYSEITDENGIGNAELYYKRNSDTVWTSVLMSKNGDQYSGEIPVQSEITTISYYVQAEDNAVPLNKSTDPPDAPDSCYSFTICSLFEGPQSNGFSVYVHPNPFLSNATIKYDVPFESRIHIKIYAISGNMVKKSIYDDVCPGHHSIKLETKELSNGVYFMKFYAMPKYVPDKKYTAIKKLVLIK